MHTLMTPTSFRREQLDRQDVNHLSLNVLHWYQNSLAGHTSQVKFLAEAVARQLRRKEREVHLLGVAALLHDIGKMAIPSALLNKPGPLTEQEWTIMRLHPLIGSCLLEKAGGIWSSIAPFVLAHHERWDGLGYPYGLVGEAIPLEARILAVVDSYTAMIEQRPYRSALAPAEARAEIRRCTGSAYDPQVANALLALLPQNDD